MHKQAEPRPGFVPAEADGRTAFGLVCEECGLPPFQGFMDLASFRQARSSFQHQLAQIRQMRARSWRAGVQDSGHFWWRGGYCGGCRQERSPFLRRFALFAVKRTSRIRF